MKNYIAYSYLHWILSLLMGVAGYCMYTLNFNPFLYFLIMSIFGSFILVLIPVVFCFVFLKNEHVKYIHLSVSAIIIFITFFTLDDPDNDYVGGSMLIASSIISTFLLKSRFKLNE